MKGTNRFRVEVPLARVEYADNPYAVPAFEADVADRVSFLRRVAGLTFLGLTISGATSIASAMMVFLFPFLGSGYMPMIMMLGALIAARGVGSAFVYNENTGVAMAGFLGGTALQGVAMGYIILAAVFVSAQAFGNPFFIIFEAMGLVALTMMGMAAYLLTGPKNLSMVGGFLSAVSLPMMVLMVVSFLMPGLFGGPMGLLFNLIFIVTSAAGLLYSLNNVMHKMSTDQAIPGAYFITMGILTLFWNILTLLMRLQRR